MLSEVMTVTGPVRPEELGFTLIHEHVFLSILPDYLDTNRVLDDPDRLPELFKDVKQIKKKITPQ